LCTLFISLSRPLSRSGGVAQARRDRGENYLFSFAAETAANENHHAFDKAPTRHSFGDCALPAVKPAQRA